MWNWLELPWEQEPSRKLWWAPVGGKGCWLHRREATRQTLPTWPLAESWPGLDVQNQLTAHLVPELPLSAGNPTWPHGYSTGGRGIQGSAQIYGKPRARGENFGWVVLPSTPAHPIAHPDYRAGTRTSPQKPVSVCVMQLLPASPCPGQGLGSPVYKAGGAVCSAERELAPTPCKGLRSHQVSIRTAIW